MDDSWCRLALGLPLLLVSASCLGCTGDSSGSGDGGSGSSSSGSASGSSSSGASASSGGSSGSALIPAPASGSMVHDICALQIDNADPGQSSGSLCGFNPNFTDTWSGGVPGTCLDLPKACMYVSGGMTYTAPTSVTFKITSGFPTPLTAKIVNCQTSPSNDHGASCVESNDSAGTPLSHKLSWGTPNGNVGPETTLTVTQIGSSDGTPLQSVPHSQWPGGDVLITDPYGNAVIFSFSATYCATTGAGPDQCQ